ncbi:D-alanyl-D-alanine carboxypeptidase family protein [uncultured Umboniibacter sp.]|uniref:D-alanyl-D-alanine carboxypeptidase family protein n=1 Tax=uncultured Umboniibacter sp. TaxID=1798917 RepID=UPI00262C65D3|nr:D-alanyl-D-alanine carboxypeptidase family protein [uncultured Umboniibacter sp.]
MKFRSIITTTLFLIAGFQSALAAPVIVPRAPDLNASSWILIDATTGRILTENNSNERLPPASLTKMMTAYIVSKEVNEGRISESDLVPISVNAWRMGGSKMFVREGTSVQLLELLRGLMIVSGNDATVALAEYVAGSETAFADVMNQQAQLIGMENTNFKNSTGWPADNHYTTAADLSKLAQRLIQDHPDHYRIYSERRFSYTPPGESAISQPNRNLLLGRDPSVDGMKTGHTQEAGYCLVSSALRDGTRLIAVVMGTSSPNARATESANLLQWGFRYFETQTVLAAGQNLESAKVWKSTIDQVELTVPNDLTLTLNRGSFDGLAIAAQVNDQLEAPLSAGDVVGFVEVQLDGETVGRSDIVVANDVPEAGFFKRLWDSIVLFFTGLFS